MDNERVYDLLKHISTLDVAAIILFLALLKDYGAEDFLPGVPSMVLFSFGISLVLALYALFALTFFPKRSDGVSEDPPGTGLMTATGISFLFLVAALTLAILIGARAI